MSKERYCFSLSLVVLSFSLFWHGEMDVMVGCVFSIFFISHFLISWFFFSTPEQSDDGPVCSGTGVGAEHRAGQAVRLALLREWAAPGMLPYQCCGLGPAVSFAGQIRFSLMHEHLGYVHCFLFFIYCFSLCKKDTQRLLRYKVLGDPM